MGDILLHVPFLFGAQMKNKNLILSFFIILTLFFFFVPLISQFTISNGKTNEIVFMGSIKDYKYFHISFLHSVNKTPVNEFYEIRNNKFIVYKTTFYSFGAGMPDGEIKNGRVEINDINRELKDFTYMVGTDADHTLYAGDKSFNLEKYIEHQQPALFRIKRCSIFNILWRQFNHE